MKTITTYAEFWPYYLREHARPATRAWHYVGTAIAIGVLIAVIMTGALGVFAVGFGRRLCFRLDEPRAD